MKITKKIETYEPNINKRYDFPIGYVFIMNDQKYIVIKNEHCNNCDVKNLGMVCASLLCGEYSRKDESNVIFKKI